MPTLAETSLILDLFLPQLRAIEHGLVGVLTMTMTGQLPRGVHLQTALGLWPPNLSFQSRSVDKLSTTLVKRHVSRNRLDQHGERQQARQV